MAPDVSVRTSALLLGIGLLCFAPIRAGAAEEGPFHCRPGEWRGFRPSLVGTSDASIDLYNGMLWASAAGAVWGATEPPDDPRWSERNGFDKAVRRGLVLDGSGRTAAAGVSDGLWGVMMAAPLLGDGLKTWSDGHCDRAFGLASHWAESMALTALVTSSTKVIAARERPGSDDRESFFSGHAALSATGAGLLCRHALRDETWGPGPLQKAIPCGLGIAGALTTGLLRVAADKHWMTDVLVSWGVGGVLGYFDLPGPFDLLRFTVRGDDGQPRAEGLVVPYAGHEAVGARFSLRFR